MYVHPFFEFMQEEYDPSTRFKQQYEGEWDDNNIFKVPQAKVESLTTKKFYRYFLTQNAPLHLVDGCEKWNAISLWNDDYLSKHLGNFGMKYAKIASTNKNKVEERFDKFEFKEDDAKPMTDTISMQSFTDRKNYLQDFTHKGSIEDDTDSYLGSSSGKPVDESKYIYL